MIYESLYSILRFKNEWCCLKNPKRHKEKGRGEKRNKNVDSNVVWQQVGSAFKQNIVVKEGTQTETAKSLF